MQVTQPSGCYRVLPGKAFEGLEPCDGRLSRTVLRGRGGSNASLLPGAALRSLRAAADAQIVGRTLLQIPLKRPLWFVESAVG